MKFLHINTENFNKKDSESNKTPIQELKSNMTNDVFALIYMEGCGPCNATRPEWKKLENILENNNNNDKDVLIVDIDKDILGKIPFFKINPSGYPTMVYMKLNKPEHYEDSNIENKDRTVDSFVEWIESKTKNKTNYGGKSKKNTKKNYIKRNKNNSKKNYIKRNKKNTKKRIKKNKK